MRFLSFRQLADVYPFLCVRIAEQFIQVQLDGAVSAADSRKDRHKAFQALIQIHWDARLDVPAIIFCAIIELEVEIWQESILSEQKKKSYPL